MNRGIKLLIAISVIFGLWVVLAPKIATALIVERGLKKADVIIVLSGSAVYQERTRRAALAYREGISKTVVLSDDGGEAGWSQTENRNPKFVELARRSLVGHGVPSESIIEMDSDVSGTNEEAEAFENEAAKRGWKSVLIVTSAYHSRRALRTFEKKLAGREIEIGIVSAPPGERTPAPSVWWMKPIGWRFVAGEYLKTAYYWVFY